MAAEKERMTMMNRRDRQGAAERMAERQQRERAAPRLKEEVPSIVGLRIEIEERRSDGTDTMKHTRLIVVDRAAALFQVPCGEKDCTDGGHDLTREIMYALRKKLTQFDGKDVCYGRRHANECRRELSYSAEAAFEPDA
jgi:GTPase Era involved in 16S rRNA processing